MSLSAIEQIDREARYRREHESWLKRLQKEDPKQYALVCAKRLDKLPNDFNLRHKQTDASDREDLEEFPQAPQEYEPTAARVNAIEITATHPLVVAQVKCALRIVAAELLAAKNRDMWAECFSISTSLSYMGASEASVAKRLGVKRAAVSKQVKELQAVLSLTPSGPMRKLTTCVKYVARALNVHARQDGRFV